MASLGRRDDALERLTTATFEVLVVGGGITGAGVALEAVLHGHSCALVEGADFASGASSRSSKLVHGGLRYLLQGDVALVRESLAERAFLLRNAPSLVAPLPYLLPLDSLGDGADAVERLLAAYDGLAGSRSRLPAPRRLTAAKAAARGFSGRAAAQGALEYHEAVTDDARLTLAVLAAAAARGAVVANHLGLDGLESGHGSVVAVVRDELARTSLEVRARTVVLAVGPWLGGLTARLRGLDEVGLRPSRGTHVVFGGAAAPLATAVAVPHPRDGRPVSVVPWKGRLVLGTTDGACDSEDVGDTPATADDVRYLIEALGPLLPDGQEATAAWTGVRPLYDDGAGSTVDLSRGDRVAALAPRVVGVTGGKLTTFRPVARRAFRLAAERSLGTRGRASRYPRLAAPLPAAGPADELVAGLGLGVEALRAAAAEMAATLDDVLTQRLGVSLVAPDDAAALAPSWAETVGEVLGWTAVERTRQVASYRAGLGRFTVPAA